MKRIDPDSLEGKAKMAAMDRLLEHLDYSKTKPKEKGKPKSEDPANDGDADVEAIVVQEDDPMDDGDNTHREEPPDDIDDGPIDSAAETARAKEDDEDRPHKTLDMRALRREVQSTSKKAR